MRRPTSRARAAALLPLLVALVAAARAAEAGAAVAAAAPSPASSPSPTANGSTCAFVSSSPRYWQVSALVRVLDSTGESGLDDAVVRALRVALGVADCQVTMGTASLCDASSAALSCDSPIYECGSYIVSSDAYLSAASGGCETLAASPEASSSSTSTSASVATGCAELPDGALEQILTGSCSASCSAIVLTSSTTPAANASSPTPSPSSSPTTTTISAATCSSFSVTIATSTSEEAGDVVDKMLNRSVVDAVAESIDDYATADMSVRISIKGTNTMTGFGNFPPPPPPPVSLSPPPPPPPPPSPPPPLASTVTSPSPTVATTSALSVSLSAWWPCSASCGTGYTGRTEVCYGENSIPTAAQNCIAAGMFLSTLTQSCSAGACSSAAFWSYSGWSTCSATCGGGTSRRLVDCYLSDAAPSPSPPVDGLVEAPSPAASPSAEVVQYCGGVALDSSYRKCNTAPCEVGYWSTGEWSECSTGCGAGTSNRSVDCISPLTGEAIADELCDDDAKPADERVCGATDGCCAESPAPAPTPLGVVAPSSEDGCLESSDTSVVQWCASGLKDATGACCDSGLVSSQGACCGRLAVLDAEGVCCASGQLNACGECVSKSNEKTVEPVVDVVGACCASGTLDPAGLCCASGTLDECGVCDGAGDTCNLVVTVIVEAPFSKVHGSGVESSWAVETAQDMFDAIGAGEVVSAKAQVRNATWIASTAGRRLRESGLGSVRLSTGRRNADLDPAAVAFENVLAMPRDGLAARMEEPNPFELRHLLRARESVDGAFWSPESGSRRALFAVAVDAAAAPSSAETASADERTTLVVMTATARGSGLYTATAAGAPDALQALQSNILLVVSTYRASFCGNGICEAGEADVPGQTGLCPDDCAASAADGGCLRSGCSNAGVCVVASGACACFEGREGDSCELCAPGWVRIDGNACSADSALLGISSEASVSAPPVYDGTSDGDSVVTAQGASPDENSAAASQGASPGGAFSTVAQGTSPGGNSAEARSGTLSGGAIAGVVVGSLAGTVVLVTLFAVVLRRRRRGPAKDAVAISGLAFAGGAPTGAWAADLTGAAPHGESKLAKLAGKNAASLNSFDEWTEETTLRERYGVEPSTRDDRIWSHCGRGPLQLGRESPPEELDDGSGERSLSSAKFGLAPDSPRQPRDRIAAVRSSDAAGQRARAVAAAPVRSVAAPHLLAPLAQPSGVPTLSSESTRDAIMLEDDWTSDSTATPAESDLGGPQLGRLARIVAGRSLRRAGSSGTPSGHQSPTAALGVDDNLRTQVCLEAELPRGSPWNAPRRSLEAARALLGGRGARRSKDAGRERPTASTQLYYNAAYSIDSPEGKSTDLPRPMESESAHDAARDSADVSTAATAQRGLGSDRHPAGGSRLLLRDASEFNAGRSADSIAHRRLASLRQAIDQLDYTATTVREVSGRATASDATGGSSVAGGVGDHGPLAIAPPESGGRSNPSRGRPFGPGDVPWPDARQELEDARERVAPAPPADRGARPAVGPSRRSETVNSFSSLQSSASAPRRQIHSKPAESENDQVSEGGPSTHARRPAVPPVPRYPRAQRIGAVHSFEGSNGSHVATPAISLDESANRSSLATSDANSVVGFGARAVPPHMAAARLNPPVSRDVAPHLNPHTTRDMAPRADSHVSRGVASHADSHTSRRASRSAASPRPDRP